MEYRIARNAPGAADRRRHLVQADRRLSEARGVESLFSGLARFVWRSPSTANCCLKAETLSLAKKANQRSDAEFDMSKHGGQLLIPKAAWVLANDPALRNSSLLCNSQFQGFKLLLGHALQSHRGG
jgi:hypothetical protein